jgi:hypothetical protein
MHDLGAELHALPRAATPEPARDLALRLETRQLFSIHRELLVALYIAVASVIAGVGWLVRANLDRIGPITLLVGILAASALCYALALRALAAARERSLGEDYVLLLGALLFSAAVGYAEAQFNVFGAGWSRHLLWLCLWHVGTAYFLSSRLVLSVGLAAFAAWMGVEARLGSLLEPHYRWFGLGPRALVCALLFWSGGWVHRESLVNAGNGFRDVYRQFAANFAFWGALALGADPDTRWFGAVTLMILAFLIGRAGMAERRQSFLLYAVGYGTAGLVQLEDLVLDDRVVRSWLGLLTIIGALAVLMRLRARLKESGT